MTWSVLSHVLNPPAKPLRKQDHVTHSRRFFIITLVGFCQLDTDSNHLGRRTSSCQLRRCLCKTGLQASKKNTNLDSWLIREGPVHWGWGCHPWAGGPKSRTHRVSQWAALFCNLCFSSSSNYPSSRTQRRKNPLLPKLLLLMVFDTIESKLGHLYTSKYSFINKHSFIFT